MTEEEQTASEIRDRVEKDLLSMGMKPAMVQIILVHPNIAIVDREAELPQLKEPLTASKEENSLVGLGYNCCKQDMLKAGWVKEIK